VSPKNVDHNIFNLVVNVSKKSLHTILLRRYSRSIPRKIRLKYVQLLYKWVDKLALLKADNTIGAPWKTVVVKIVVLEPYNGGLGLCPNYWGSIDSCTPPPIARPMDNTTVYIKDDERAATKRM